MLNSVISCLKSIYVIMLTIEVVTSCDDRKISYCFSFQEQQRYQDLCIASSDDCQRSSSDCDVISTMTLEALKQIVLVLNEGQNMGSLEVAKETLVSTLKDLIPLLSNHAN